MNRKVVSLGPFRDVPLVSGKGPASALFQFLDFDQKVSKQAFTELSYFVPQTASNFTVPVTNINTALFRNCPCHTSTSRSKAHCLSSTLHAKPPTACRCGLSICISSLERTTLAKVPSRGAKFCVFWTALVACVYSHTGRDRNTH